MDSFNHLPAESLWSMPSDERCWVNLIHLVLTGNIWDVPGPGTWEVGWSELFSQVTPGLGSTFSIHFFHWDSVRFCEILYPPGFAGRRWSSGLGSDCFPTQCLYMFMSKTYFWKFQFFLFVRTPQCSSDDLPQLSVFEAFFVSMPCCCRLDLGSVIWDRCLQAEHGNVQFLWWIQYRKYMKSQYIELFTHWITKMINVETRVL